MKLTIAILLANGFPVPATFFKSYALLQQAIITGAYNAALPRGREISTSRVIFGHDFPIDHARNRLVRLFLDEDDGDALLFLDADMGHPPDLAHRLVAHGKDVVTARYQMRKPPFFTVAMKKTGPGPCDYESVDKVVADTSGLVPIDSGGAGALLISRRALDDIRASTDGDWFRYQDGPDGRRSRSEDMWFYEQAKAAGYQPYLDGSLYCTHCASFDVDYSFHGPYAEAYRKKMSEVTA